MKVIELSPHGTVHSNEDGTTSELILYPIAQSEEPLYSMQRIETSSELILQHIV
jgi:hypothetical protein